MEIIEGDLFETDAKYIAHQCNCVTNRPAHLSKKVFERYPYADIYTGRKEPSKPGSIVIRGNGKDKRYVINILGQYYPGKVKYPSSKLDGFEARKGYFYQGLRKIQEIQGLESIAFPYGIGCGAAGGDWDFYLSLIEKFSKHTEADVHIYKLPDANIIG